jgi:hypothetical protein
VFDLVLLVRFSVLVAVIFSSLVFSVDTLFYFLVSLGCSWVVPFIMWFLDFITTFLLVGSVSSLGNVYYV